VCSVHNKMQRKACSVEVRDRYNVFRQRCCLGWRAGQMVVCVYNNRVQRKACSADADVSSCSFFWQGYLAGDI
jgi:hypothetical protein